MKLISRLRGRRCASTVSLATVNMARIALESTLKKNVKTCQSATMLRTATKDTLKYAKVLTLTIVHLKQKCAYKHQKPSVDNDQVKINEK